MPESPSDARGLYRWPELYEFSGPVSFILDDGSQLDASCMEIKTESYLAQLSSLLTSEDYSLFFDVIRYMIQNRVRLEQEALLH